MTLVTLAGYRWYQTRWDMFWFAESKRHVATKKGQRPWTRCDETSCGMCAQTPQPRDRGKTNKDHACKLKAMDSKNVTKLDYTSRFVQQCFSRNLGQTTSLAETVNHGLAEAGHQTRPRRGEAPSNTTRERMALNFVKHWFKYHETLKTFPRIRELMESFQTENKTLLGDSRLHSGTLWQQSNEMYMSGQSLQNSTCHVKDNKTWDSPEIIKDTCRDQQGKVTHYNWRSKRGRGNTRKHDTEFRVVQTIDQIESHRLQLGNKV